MSVSLSLSVSRWTQILFLLEPLLLFLYLSSLILLSPEHTTLSLSLSICNTTSLSVCLFHTESFFFFSQYLNMAGFFFFFFCATKLCYFI